MNIRLRHSLVALIVVTTLNCTISYCDTLNDSYRKLFNHLLGDSSITTLEQANKFAQENLLRKGERWDKQDNNPWRDVIYTKTNVLLDDLKSLGMIDAQEPQQKSYTYVLLMGALTPTVQHRLDFLAELKKNGLTFQKIVLLGGERPLRENEKEGLPKNVTTEAHMMNYLCAQHPLLKNDRILVINAPMIKNSDGTFTRPNTDNTIVHFAQTAPTDGSCLVIANNPYIARQTKVTRRLLNQKHFPTDGAGSKINLEKIDIVILMDEFARLIYEEYQATLK